ncbi:hypothetical protein GCM10010398_44110 [Streptomyces fimbriatus]
MPEPTPYLHAANTPFHKEARNQPVHRGRAVVDAPCAATDASGQRHTAPYAPPLGGLRERPDRYGGGAPVSRTARRSGGGVGGAEGVRRRADAAADAPAGAPGRVTGRALRRREGVTAPERRYFTGRW